MCHTAGREYHTFEKREKCCIVSSISAQILFKQPHDKLDNKAWIWLTLCPGQKVTDVGSWHN